MLNFLAHSDKRRHVSPAGISSAYLEKNSKNESLIAWIEKIDGQRWEYIADTTLKLSSSHHFEMYGFDYLALRWQSAK